MKIGQRRGKGSKLYVQPAELARKLVKEMEDHKVPRSGRTLVHNRYTVFLCPDDYRRFQGRQGSLAQKLERHLAKHVKARGYDSAGELSVIIDVDPDLSLGYFGILAEGGAVGVPLEQPDRALRPTGMREAERTVGSTLVAPRQSASSTGVLTAAEAAGLGLARQTIVIRSGARKQEFTQGRVLIGRAREADFRIEDPQVSRRHATVFWSNGDLTIRDLDSTNGTIVNGRPISTAVIRPGDEVMIGGYRLTIDAG